MVPHHVYRSEEEAYMITSAAPATTPPARLQARRPAHEAQVIKKAKALEEDTTAPLPRRVD